MPVRTGRGRVAVYRRVWGWPMRSRVHLVAAIVGLVAVAGAVSIALAAVEPSVQPSAPPPPTTTRPALPVPPPSRVIPSVTSTVTPSTQPPTAAPPEALAVAADFAARWVVHPPGMTSPQFTEQLAPLAEPELLITLADVDPSRVPNSQVTGPPRATSGQQQLVQVEVPTDAGALQLAVVQTPQGWRVHHMEEVA